MTNLQNILKKVTENKINSVAETSVNATFEDLTQVAVALFGDRYTPQYIEGRDGNAGVVFSGDIGNGKTESFLELWNNSHKKRPSIAFRPTPQIAQELGLTEDSNGIEGVTFSHPKGHLTHRYVVSQKAVADFFDKVYFGSLERDAKRLDVKIKESQQAAGKTA